MIISCKEDLLKYMRSGIIHVSRKDYGFYNNLYFIIKDNKPLTSNQDKLFDKLTRKYQKQLSRNNQNIENLLSIQWECEVVETRQEYLNAWLTLNNNILILRTPFNSKFIQELKQHNIVEFIWNKTERVYSTQYSTVALKFALDTLKKHFPIIKYSEEINSLIDKTLHFDDVKYWDPTYVCINNNYYVVATNSHVQDAIKNIHFDNSLTTLNQLSLAGIKIHESIIQEDPSKSFASNYYNEIDIDNLDQLCNWLKLINVDTVIASRDLIHNKKLKTEIFQKCLDRDIKISTDSNNVGNTFVYLKTLTYDYYDDDMANKVVLIKNSRPIKVK